MAKKITDKQYLEDWGKFRDNVDRATPVDLNETPAQKKKRIERLEKNPEEWFQYYFPNFYTSTPAPFHLAATYRVLSNPEWYEVRSWARELSKSGRTMMEVLFLALTGKKRNILLISNTYDNACRLLLPYKSILEKNNRIINDYGEQESFGQWEAGEFVTKKGVAFRALGAGQSPRGTRKDEVRPDVILIDDIDTDQDCRNADIIAAKVKWIEEALIPTRSISNALLLIVCGNIIAEYCCVTEMGDKADCWDIVNIRDENGKSTWPSKNTEELIDRVLSMISDNSAQKEYFNNPIIEGETFDKVTYDDTPAWNKFEKILAYADPATSNKDKQPAKGNTARKGQKKGTVNGASTKCVIIIGLKDFVFYTLAIWLDNCNNSTFVDWMFEAEEQMRANKVQSPKIHIENNSLQDPFYQQVIRPLIKKKSRARGRASQPPIIEDKRKKPEKYDRIDGTLQPLHKNGQLRFSSKLRGNPHMKRMEGQMLAVSPNCKKMDGPDGLEGGVWLLQNRAASTANTHAHAARPNRKF